MKSLPEILTAKTYFWSPAISASHRRSNEHKRLSEVESFLKELGFKTEIKNDRVFGLLNEIEVIFHYEETTGHVYKDLTVRKNGKNSNITTLKKLINA